MRYTVEVSGRRIDVEVTAQNGTARVALDGRTYHAELRRVAGSEHVLLLDGRAIILSAERQDDAVRVTCGGRVLDLTVLGERERALQDVVSRARRARAKEGPTVVTSVMPGVVTLLSVKEGDAVVRGTPLLVLEAMKMENEVRAEAEGKVLRIHVRRGQAVASGAPLLEIG